MLADDVLPLIRTRADLHRWSASTQHGRQMHMGVDILAAAIDTTDPGEFYTVTHKALASAVKVIARADDSSGVIGDACRRLLDLHPRAAHRAGISPAKLADWMITFQFDGDVDFFTIDPVAYAPALGDRGLARYRERLEQIEAELGPRPDDEFSSRARPEWFELGWNARRLAVLDRDVDAIIRTHSRDRKVAAWLEDTARALEEIGEIDLAIDWAKQATDFGPGHQSIRAAAYWCALLEEHRPGEALAARATVFERWPSASSAAALHRSAGPEWADHHDTVMATLSADPREAVLFALHTLADPDLAWTLAHNLEMSDFQAWNELVKAYQVINPLAALPIHRQLVETELVGTGVQHYRRAAKRLKTMRKLAAGTSAAADTDAYIVELRHTHRRRPRLRTEFDRAGLP